MNVIKHLPLVKRNWSKQGIEILVNNEVTIDCGTCRLMVGYVDGEIMAYNSIFDVNSIIDVGAELRDEYLIYIKNIKIEENYNVIEFISKENRLRDE